MRLHPISMTLALAACAPEGGRQTTATAVTITGATTIADDGTTTAATAEATSDATCSGATCSATAANYARSGDGIYTATCAPAWF